MRSSTSSSEARVAGHWWLVWLLGAALTLAPLTAFELWLRARGFRAGVTSEYDHWAEHRARVVGADRHTLALLGTSRMQSNVDQPVLRRALPKYTPVQLAIAATGPLAVLQDLAHDATFRGTVLCEVGGITLGPNKYDQHPYVRYYWHEWNLPKRVALHINLPLELRLRLLQPVVSARRLVRALSTGRPPRPQYETVLPDRTRVFDYAGHDIEAYRAKRVRRGTTEERPVSSAEFAGNVEEFIALARRIEARGGRVVFVRFPTRGTYQHIEDEYYPRAHHWDRLVGRAGVKTLDVHDMPDVSTLEIPDHSHFTPASATRFTRWLAEQLVRRDLL